MNQTWAIPCMKARNMLPIGSTAPSGGGGDIFTLQGRVIMNTTALLVIAALLPTRTQPHTLRLTACKREYSPGTTESPIHWNDTSPATENRIFTMPEGLLFQ